MISRTLRARSPNTQHMVKLSREQTIRAYEPEVALVDVHQQRMQHGLAERLTKNFNLAHQALLILTAV